MAVCHERFPLLFRWVLRLLWPGRKIFLIVLLAARAGVYSSTHDNFFPLTCICHSGHRDVRVSLASDRSLCLYFGEDTWVKHEHWRSCRTSPSYTDQPCYPPPPANNLAFTSARPRCLPSRFEAKLLRRPGVLCDDTPYAIFEALLLMNSSPVRDGKIIFSL